MALSALSALSALLVNKLEVLALLVVSRLCQDIAYSSQVIMRQLESILFVSSSFKTVIVNVLKNFTPPQAGSFVENCTTRGILLSQLLLLQYLCSNTIMLINFFVVVNLMAQLKVVMDPEQRRQHLRTLLDLEGLFDVDEQAGTAYCPISLTSTPVELNYMQVEKLN